MKALLSLTLTLLLFLSPRALAAMYADQGAAYSACMAAIAKGPSAWQPMKCRESKSSDGSGNYAAWDRTGRDVGWQWFSWAKATDCSKRSEETGWRGQPGVTTSACHNGCAYTSSIDAQSPTGYTFWPSGSVCTTNEMAPPEVADPGGDDDGGGTGGETGGGDGDGGGGNDGGGGDGGSGGEGGGNGDGDGEGDGDGDGDGDGTDPGTGPGNGDGGDGGGDGAGPTTGRLYKKSGKTVQKVLADFKTAIEGAPILSKVKGFFGSCTGGGSCPTATWDGGQYAGKFDLSSLCSGPLLQLFQYAGFVFLAGMGAVALRWALL